MITGSGKLEVAPPQAQGNDENSPLLGTKPPLAISSAATAALVDEARGDSGPGLSVLPRNPSDETSDEEVKEVDINNLTPEMFMAFVQELIDTIVRILAQALCTASPAIEPLFAGFLYLGIMEFFNGVAVNYGYATAFAYLNYIQYAMMAIAITLAFGFNLPADLLSVDPINEAEALVEKLRTKTPKEIKKADAEEKTLREELLKDRKLYWINPVTSLQIGRGFKHAMIALALPGFITLALADGVAVCEVPFMKDTSLGLKAAISAVIAIEGATYYMMFTGNKIAKHTAEYTDAFFRKGFNGLQTAWKNLPATLVVSLRAGANIIYRGASTANIAKECLIKIVGLAPEHPAIVPSMLLLGGSVAIITAVSRVLQVRDQFINPLLSQVTTAQKKDPKIQAPLLNDIFNVNLALSMATGTSLSIFTHSLLSIANPYAKAGVAMAPGALLGVLLLYVLRDTELKNKAIKEFNIVADQSEQDKKNKVNVLNYKDTAEKTYDEIAKELLTPRIKNVISAINNGGGFARFLAFIGFVISLNKSLLANGIDLGLDFTAQVAAGACIGITYLSGDRPAYKESMEEFVGRARAKIKIGNPFDSTKKVEGSAVSQALQMFNIWRTPMRAYNPAVTVGVLNEIRRNKASI